jgi:hypothetical protein
MTIFYKKTKSYAKILSSFAIASLLFLENAWCGGKFSRMDNFSEDNDKTPPPYTIQIHQNQPITIPTELLDIPNENMIAAGHEFFYGSLRCFFEKKWAGSAWYSLRAAEFYAIGKGDAAAADMYFNAGLAFNKLRQWNRSKQNFLNAALYYARADQKNEAEKACHMAQSAEQEER